MRGRKKRNRQEKKYRKVWCVRESEEERKRQKE